MSYTVRPVEIPDFNATWDRAQASRQNALAMQMQQREWQQSAEFDNALRQYGPALMGQDATARTNALSALGGLGGRGLAAAAPFHQTEQQRFRTMTPQEVAAAGFRPGTVARVNALGAIQTDQASDVLSPEAERQRLRLAYANHAPRISWTDVKDDSGNLIGQRASNGEFKPRDAAPNMFGTGAGGLALQYMTRAADAYATGQLQGPDAQRFEAALALYQQPRTQFDQATGQMVTITPPLPPFIAEAIARRGGQQPQGAPPAAPQPQQAPVQPAAAPAAPAPVQGGAMPIGQTGMVAAPPPAPNGGVTLRQVGPQQMPPANIVGGMLENASSLRKIDEGLAMLRTPAGQGGVGIVAGVVPGAILDRANPSGVDVRAIIADIGSLKIHDRSGAAVSASEFPRLRGFVPSLSDNPETIQRKLANFRREYLGILQDQYATYGPTGGYRPIPAVEAALSAGAGQGGSAPAEAPANPFNLRIGR